MNIALLAIVVILVIVPAMAGPLLVHWSAPRLMRVPRLASGLLLSALAVWLLAVAAVSLTLAGLVSGPRLLAAPFAGVCQRCLASASPFSPSVPLEVPVPVAVFVLLPLGGTALLAVLGVRRLLLRAASTRAVLTEVMATGERTEIAGHRVLMVPDPRPLAFTLPRRRGGIVLSHGLVDALDPDELSAVLEHEEAHLAQHHHAVLALMDALAGPLRAVPLVGAILNAVPLLLEIAADDVSRHHSGTPALASALLTLGGPGAHLSTPAGTTVAGTLLHATGPAGTGPDRIGHLVAPTEMRSSVLPATTLSALVVLFGGIGLAVVGPFAMLLLTGCALPA